MGDRDVEKRNSGNKVGLFVSSQKEYWKNRLLLSNQLKFHQVLDGKSHEEIIISGKGKTRELWSRIWEKDLKHNKSVDWIQKIAQ